MKIKRYTIKDTYVRTLSWFNGQVVDWASAGTAYSLDGKKEQLQKYRFAYSFDSALTSEDGVYVLLYRKLGTKALLLKNGEDFRELNRSYYQSEVFEYPAAFFKDKNGRTCIAHCPNFYNRLEFEDAETGEILTKSEDRTLQDIFHSRLTVSPDGKFLLSRGWVWHPFDVIELFDIEKCSSDPKLLDQGKSVTDCGNEIGTASFIDNDHILIGSFSDEGEEDDEPDVLPVGHFAVWNFKTAKISAPVKPESRIGNLIAVNSEYAWDLYEYPKIINIKTGKTEAELRDIDTGRQNSSIIHHLPEPFLLSAEKGNRRLAVSNGSSVEVLELDAVPISFEK